jgi:hypothetical protein
MASTPSSGLSVTDGAPDTGSGSQRVREAVLVEVVPVVPVVCVVPVVAIDAVSFV